MDADELGLDGPGLVQWSPRRGLPVGDPGAAVYLLALVGVAAIGAMALGALGFGILGVGQLKMGRRRTKTLRIGHLDMGELLVRRRNARPF